MAPAVAGAFIGVKVPTTSRDCRGVGSGESVLDPLPRGLPVLSDFLTLDMPRLLFIVELCHHHSSTPALDFFHVIRRL